MLAIIGHPAGEPKHIEAGPVFKLEGDRIRYNDIDTLGGKSGSAVWHAPSGEIVPTRATARTSAWSPAPRSTTTPSAWIID